ncbi:MAG: TolB family protein [Gemmatimonadaceae bacterium]
MGRAMMRALAVLLGGTAPLVAQGGSDLYVAAFHEVGTHVSIGRPVNVTNRVGYDNQPTFTADGRALLFTSIREDAQADIWRVTLATNATERLTRTTESEYSATRTPDGLAMSVIRVERDSTQRLWRFPFDGSAPTVMLPGLRPVGYHVWVNAATLGAFILGAPNALVLADPRTDRVDTLARDIGRALVRVPDRDAFTFVQLARDTSWISEVDVRTRTVRRIAPLPPGAEYHLWTPSGQLIITAGSRLLIRVRDQWDLLADFAPLGIRGLSRIALSPTGDRIAFVAADPGPR